MIILYNEGGKSMRKEMMNMATISQTIDRIIETSSKVPSKQEAQKVLRSCGILDSKNNIKPAYKKIIIESCSRKNGHK